MAYATAGAGVTDDHIQRPSSVGESVTAVAPSRTLTSELPVLRSDEKLASSSCRHRNSKIRLSMHPAYRNLLLARASALVAEAQAFRAVNHNGLKEQLRETLVRLLLRPLLPPQVGVGTGEVITHNGKTSTQQDVVVFDKTDVPPLLVGDVGGLFPLESLVYTVEVKSILSIEELRKANESARSIDTVLGDLTYFIEDHPAPQSTHVHWQLSSHLAAMRSFAKPTEVREHELRAGEQRTNRLVQSACAGGVSYRSAICEPACWERMDVHAVLLLLAPEQHHLSKHWHARRLPPSKPFVFARLPRRFAGIAQNFELCCAHSVDISTNVKCKCFNSGGGPGIGFDQYMGLRNWLRFRSSANRHSCCT